MYSPVGANPQPAIFIFFYPRNKIGKRTIRISFEKIINSECFLAFIVPVQTVCRADPDESISILAYMIDEITAKAIGIARFIKEMLNLIRFTVQKVQSVVCSDPDIVLIIFQERIDGWMA
jgi:hypothetical protein